MLNATRLDSSRVEVAVASLLKAQDKLEVKFIAVNLRDFYLSCKLRDLRSTKFADEISDTLCGTEFIAAHGLWLFCEFESNVYFFIKIVDKSVVTQADVQSSIVTYLVKEGMLVGSKNMIRNLESVFGDIDADDENS